jgi:hypothetical protein
VQNRKTKTNNIGKRVTGEKLNKNQRGKIDWKVKEVQNMK